MAIAFLLVLGALALSAHSAGAVVSATITGYVGTAPQGTGLNGVQVLAYTADPASGAQPIASAYTATGPDPQFGQPGYYTFNVYNASAVTMTVYLEFVPPYNGSPDVSEWYQSAEFFSQAAGIKLTGGPTTVAANMTLNPGGVIQGLAEPPTTGQASVAQLFVVGTGGRGPSVLSSGGSYSFTHLQPGTYTLCFSADPTHPTSADECYNCKPYSSIGAGADTIAVGYGSNITINYANLSTGCGGGSGGGGGGGGGSGGGGGGGSGGGGSGGGGGGGGSGGGGGTPGNPFVSAAVLHALLLGHIVPSGKALHIPALLKAGGFVVTFKAPTGGKVIIAWYMVPLGARLGRAKHKPKPVLVATGQLSLSAAGTVKLKVRLTAAGRNLLRHVTHVKLTATGTFTPHGSPSVSATRTFSLKR